MKERPILFSGPMVQALLAGRKTQTRRVVHKIDGPKAWDSSDETGWPLHKDGRGRVVCPVGVAGDLLWVKETWRYYDWTEDGEPWIQYFADAKTMLRKPSEEWSDRVQDVWTELSEVANFREHGAARDGGWRPSLFMPRWASRITLEVTGVRVERVQSISADDLVAEGMPDNALAPVTFLSLWESINGKGSWDANPWVWVVEFKRAEART